MTRAILVLCCLLTMSLGAQQVPGRPEALAYEPIVFQPPLEADHKVVLQNGIPAYLVPDSSTGLVRVSLIIRGGAYMEPTAKAGLAGAMGSLWRSGGTLRTTAADLDEQLAHLAASLTSTCGPAQAALRLQVLGKDLKEGVRLMREVLLEPAFAQDRLDLLKQSTMQAMDTRNDSALDIAIYQMPLLLAGDQHFSGRQTTAATVAAVTKEDLEAFHARLIHPANMVLAVSGGFERAPMVDLLNQAFGTVQSLPGAAAAPPVPAPAHERKPGVYLCHKALPQSFVIMALPGLRRHDPDWFPTLVLNEILGGSTPAARLTRKLRSDEGLTYGVSSQFTPGPFYRGDWFLHMRTSNRSVPYAMKLIVEQLERLKNELVSDDELTVVKGILVGAFPNQFESPHEVADTFATDAADGWPEGYTTTFRKGVLAVTKADIQRVARKYFDLSKMVALVVGHAQEAQAGHQKDHPGLLKDVLPLPLVPLPLRDPRTMQVGWR